jgi:hypothetical protein
VDPDVARRLASRHHWGQITRFGEPVAEHLARVAGAVPPAARSTAWIHDLLELATIDRDQLRADLRTRGLTDTEDVALQLLTHGGAETYDAYVRRITGAGGRAGWIARAVKLADLDDHLAHAEIPPGAPPYRWARRRVLERIESEQWTPATG